MPNTNSTYSIKTYLTIITPLRKILPVTLHVENVSSVVVELIVFRDFFGTGFLRVALEALPFLPFRVPAFFLVFVAFLSRCSS